MIAAFRSYFSRYWLLLSRWLAQSRPLLKTVVRGGVLRLTGTQICFGEGWLGTRNVRCLPLAELERIDQVSDIATQSVRLTLFRTGIVWLTVAGVSPLAAHRLQTMVAILKEQLPDPTPALCCEEDKPMAEATVCITHAAGLHARPLAAFVKLAKQFPAEITVENVTINKGPVNGKSPVQLLLLKARQGHLLRIQASGPQADDAVAALVRLIATDFAQEPNHGHA